MKAKKDYRLFNHLRSLPEGSVLQWYVPTAADEGLVTGGCSDICLVISPNESLWAWILLTYELEAQFAAEALEDGLTPQAHWDYAEPHSTPGEPFIVAPTDAVDSREISTWTIPQVEEILSRWCRVVAGRDDFSFQHLEDWDFNNDRAWDFLTKQDPNEETYEVSPGVKMPSSAFASVLTLDDKERTALMKKVSKMFGENRG